MKQIGFEQWHLEHKKSQNTNIASVSEKFRGRYGSHTTADIPTKCYCNTQLIGNVIDEAWFQFGWFKCLFLVLIMVKTIRLSSLWSYLFYVATRYHSKKVEASTIKFAVQPIRQNKKQPNFCVCHY